MHGGGSSGDDDDNDDGMFTRIIGAPQGTVECMVLRVALSEKLGTQPTQFPGLPVDLLDRACLDRLSKMLVTPKTHGRRFLLFGRKTAPSRMSVYLVSTQLQFYEVAHVYSETNQVPKSFCFDGELATRLPTLQAKVPRLSELDIYHNAVVLQVFDVLMVENRRLGPQHGLLDRLKHVVGLLDFCNSGAVGRAAKFTVELKPFYQSAALLEVPRPSKESSTQLEPHFPDFAFRTDGLVFVDASVANFKTYKWKPLREISADFRLGTDNTSLFVNDRAHAVAAVCNSSRLLMKSAQVGPGDIIECVSQNVATTTSTNATAAAATNATQPTQSGGISKQFSETGLPIWRFARKRPDKSAANGGNVFDRLVAALNDAVTSADLSRALQQQLSKDRCDDSASQKGPAGRHSEKSGGSLTGRALATPSSSSSSSSSTSSSTSSSSSTSPPTHRALVANDSSTTSSCHPHQSQSLNESVLTDASNTTSYFKDVQSTKRHQSASLAAKTFHNRVVKNSLYATHANSANRVLELAVGRGADVRRICDLAPCAQYVMGVDIDNTALAEASRRWSAYQQHNHRQSRRAASAATEAAFRQVDLCDARQVATCFQHCKPFQCVMCHFAVHYFAESVGSVLQRVLAPAGGVFVATLFNAAQVSALVPRTNMKYEWRVHNATQAYIRRVSPTHVAVWVDSIGQEHVEQLVNVNRLLQSLPFPHDVVEYMTPFTAFAACSQQRQTQLQTQLHQKSPAYGPQNPMWSFTALYGVLVVRRRPAAIVQRLSSSANLLGHHNEAQRNQQPTRPALVLPPQRLQPTQRSPAHSAALTRPLLEKSPTSSPVCTSPPVYTSPPAASSPTHASPTDFSASSPTYTSPQRQSID